jgi:anti-anti-sigma regulatory factor
MRGLEYVSSAGVRVLTIMAKGLKDMDSFRITHAQGAVYEVFDAMGLTEIFGM